ncbi:MAG: pyridoxal-phosphate dependent enzyme [Candidatus Thermoplasmatota archaeon]|nr:pyridoxal-phosphate dependent enzyme [Candidatus Thermoplasmatota archaeon]
MNSVAIDGHPKEKWIPALKDIQVAHYRIEEHVHRTPVLTSRTLDSMFDCQLSFKCENFQRIGAFKIRGAMNAVLSLTDEEAEEGVATHSSGNHAQALALAAKTRGIPAYIVMPENSPKVKVEAVKGYGGRITFCEPTLEARERALKKVQERTGAHFVHPYDDPRVIAGQATVALELIDDVPYLDIIMAPVGGGGLLSGTSLSAAYLSPKTKVIGAEPESVNDAFRSFRTGMVQPPTNGETVADGLRTALSELTFSIIREHVEDIITTKEGNIIAAMRLIWERMKLVVEPSAAVTLACILEGGLDVTGKRVGIILSGGNVDLDRLPWMR